MRGKRASVSGQISWRTCLQTIPCTSFFPLFRIVCLVFHFLNPFLFLPFFSDCQLLSGPSCMVPSVISSCLMHYICLGSRFVFRLHISENYSLVSTEDSL